MNRKELHTLTLVGPTQNKPVARPPSCTTPQQPTITVIRKITLVRRKSYDLKL